MNDDCSCLAQTNPNLLLIFLVAYQNPSVSVAVTRLWVGQPTISNSLKRLCAIFDDPHFPRIGRGVKSKPKARKSAEGIGPAFGLVKQTLRW